MRRITDPVELSKYRRACVPALAQHVRCKGGDAEAWIWTEQDGKPAAVAFLGRAQNPHEGHARWFRSTEKRAAWLRNVFDLARTTEKNRIKRQADKAAARAKPHALQVGDVLRASWGYDQTNVEYFEITRLVGSQMVEFCEIGQEKEETGFMSGQCVPRPGHFIGKPQRARVSEYGARDSIRVHECAHAYKMQAHTVAGVRVFGASSWTAYA